MMSACEPLSSVATTYLGEPTGNADPPGAALLTPKPSTESLWFSWSVRPMTTWEMKPLIGSVSAAFTPKRMCDGDVSDIKDLAELEARPVDGRISTAPVHANNAVRRIPFPLQINGPVTPPVRLYGVTIPPGRQIAADCCYSAAATA